MKYKDNIYITTQFDTRKHFIYKLNMVNIQAVSLHQGTIVTVLDYMLKS